MYSNKKEKLFIARKGGGVTHAQIVDPLYTM